MSTDVGSAKTGRRIVGTARTPNRLIPKGTCVDAKQPRTAARSGAEACAVTGAVRRAPEWAVSPLFLAGLRGQDLPRCVSTQDFSAPGRAPGALCGTKSVSPAVGLPCLSRPRRRGSSREPFPTSAALRAVDDGNSVNSLETAGKRGTQ
jgi:hypothetical protein